MVGAETGARRWKRKKNRRFEKRLRLSKAGNSCESCFFFSLVFFLLLFPPLSSLSLSLSLSLSFSSYFYNSRVSVRSSPSACPKYPDPNSTAWFRM